MSDRLPDPRPRMTPEDWADLYERLGPLGRARLVAETGIQTASSLIDRVVHYAADLVVHTERAYRQGMDENISDARILEEKNRRPDA